MPKYHIAQINIGRLLAPINALADSTPGLVWRLQTDSGEATTSIRIYEDELIAINVSV